MSLHIGMVGLGRMGANMGRRLAYGGVAVTGFDPDPNARAAFAAIDSLPAADNLEALVHALPSPRVVWLMVPSGNGTEAVIAELAPRLALGRHHRRRRQCVLQGLGAARRRARQLRRPIRRLRRLRRRLGARERLRADVRRLACGGARDRATSPGSSPRRRISGWLHCGPSGSGHFVKMIHNGIEYGMMQALAEGIALLKGKTEFELDVAAIAEMWRHGSVVRSWLLDLTAEFLRARCRARRHCAGRRRFRRGTLDCARGHRAGRSGAGHVARADDALREPGQGRLRRQAARNDAQGLRRPQDRARRRAGRRAKAEQEQRRN